MKKDILSISGMHDGASPQIFDNARKLRVSMTPSEKILWEYLKDNKLGVKFRRQHPINSFVLDFYCHKKRLSVELDGKHHFQKAQMEKDLNKTKYLKSVGISEIRFTNQEIKTNIFNVIRIIQEQLNDVTL